MNKLGMDNQYQFVYDEVKNQRLRIERDVCFEDVIHWIMEGKVVEVVSHPNPLNQKMYIIEHNNLAYVVPFVRDDKTIYLKTVFPSRKAKKIFLK